MITPTIAKLAGAVAKAAPWVNLARKITLVVAAIVIASTTAGAIQHVRNEELSFLLATGPDADSGYPVVCRSLTGSDSDPQSSVVVGDYWLKSNQSLGTMSDGALLSYYDATYIERPDEIFPNTEFMAQLREDISFYCGELRENQQTEVMLIAGKGILWAMALAVLAYITAPRGPRRPYATVTGSP